MDNQESLVKNFDMIENSVEKVWDVWLVNLGNLAWTQDQIDNMSRKQLDQNKADREEMIKLVEDLSRQMRMNQEQFRNIVEENVMNTYEHINYTNQNIMGDLGKKVDELSKKAGSVIAPLFPLSRGRVI